jgi:hypothetical protein
MNSNDHNQISLKSTLPVDFVPWGMTPMEWKRRCDEGEIRAAIRRREESDFAAQRIRMGW